MRATPITRRTKWKLPRSWRPRNQLFYERCGKCGGIDLRLSVRRKTQPARLQGRFIQKNEKRDCFFPRFPFNDGPDGRSAAILRYMAACLVAHEFDGRFSQRCLLDIDPWSPSLHQFSVRICDF